MTNPLYRARLTGDEADEIAESLLNPNPSDPLPPAPRGSSVIASPESYIILPGKVHGSYSYTDLLVSIDRKYQGKNWFQAHEELHKDNSLMLNIRQYMDFLQLLKSGIVNNGRGNRIDSLRVTQLLEDITAKRDPYRAEWLDADFKVVNRVLNINYDHRNIGGELKPQRTEVLESCLMKDCSIEISSANRQGLPIRESSGDISYFYPRSDNNSVARFRANSDGVSLYCSWDPQFSNVGLGVRVAKIFK